MITIMVLKSKNITAMRKFITSILIAAAAMTACVQNDDFVVNNTNDTISFTAQVAAPNSRTVLVEDDEETLYHAEWVEGDQVSIFEITDVADGSNKYHANKPTIAADGKTATLDVTFNKWDASTYSYVFCTTSASINGAATYLGLTLPATQTPAAMDTFDGASDIIVSKRVTRDSQPNNETITFETTRISAIAEVTVKNLALAAGDKVVSVAFTCDQNIAGKLSSIKFENIDAGTPFADATYSNAVKSVTVNLPTPQVGNFKYYMNVWPATLAVGESYKVIVTTENDTFVKEGTLTNKVEFKMGDINALTINMKDIVGENSKQPEVEMPDYVTVAGIKWAMGNLEYELNGTTGDGFVTDWCIAPSQAHHFNMTVESGTDVVLTDYKKAAHFNFGGINDAVSLAYDAAIHIAAPAAGNPAFDFSGKMYTDQACTIETTNYTEAKYGDIAYYASKGQYRMPTATEFKTLYDNSCYTSATYETAGSTIYGTYYYNPGDEETAGLVEGTKVLTTEDLTVGLFLPWSGRAYNNTEYKVYKVHSQGFYRTSTVDPLSIEGQGYGVIYRVNDHSIITNDGAKTVGDKKTFNFGATSRYAIRPIYIAE